jgi:hypothetical protein
MDRDPNTYYDLSPVAWPDRTDGLPIVIDVTLGAPDAGPAATLMEAFT